MNIKKDYLQLDKILSTHFVKFSLIPILVVEIALVVLYFSINAYISSANTKLLLEEAQTHTQALLKNEANIISDKLNEVSRTASLLQSEHEAIFKNPNGFSFPNGEVSLKKAENGVLYKENKVGASLYYSSKTKATKEVINKAKFTEAMDISLKGVVETNPNIVASYFNSWDNMNRLYPFIDKVYEQYGEHIHMEDYNFYYLADLKHNPEKKPVWTGAYLDPAGNGWMLSCIVPIYNKDFLEGVTGLDITIDSFVNNILNRELPYKAKIFMVDSKGMIIAMPEEIENILKLKELKEHLYTDNILKTIEKPEEFNILKNDAPFASHFKKLMNEDKNISSLNIDDKEYLTLQQNVSETDWKLMILIDKENIFSSIEEQRDFYNKIGYAAIICLVLFYIIFFYLLLKKIRKFSFSITSPLKNLSKQTSEIKTTSSKIKHIETDILEINQLNNNFILMMNELNEKTINLYNAKLLAEEANKSKDDFLANMSHELKTPLNSINVISEVMVKNRKKNLNEKQIKNLEIVNKCGRDLLFLVNDVLDLSKLEAGQIVLNNKEINVKDFVSSIYDMFKPQTKLKDVKFVVKVDENINSIYSDEERIKQIVKNLLSNALKFTEKGEISLEVEDDKDNVKIIVKDEGIGIPKDKLEHIFDRFKQVDGSTTRKYGGTGLGLSICKELAILLKGEISVESILDEGSSFILTIPKNKHLSKKKETVKIKKDEKTKRVEKDKIIILNSDTQYFLKVFLSLKQKYNVIQSQNFDEVLAKLNEEKYEKVIVDISSSNIEETKLETIAKENNLYLIYENELDTKYEEISNNIFEKRKDIEKIIKI